MTDLMLLDRCKSLFEDVRLVELTNGEYHNRPWDSISASRLKRFRDDPKLYEMEFITEEKPRLETEALIFGRVFHELVLEQYDIVTKGNFLDGSLGVFRRCAEPQRAPDFEDGLEKIWVVSMPEAGIVRQSAVWGDLGERTCEPIVARVEQPLSEVDDQVPVVSELQTFAGCAWYAVPDRGDEVVTAMCAFADMHLDGVCFKHVPLGVLSSSGSRAGKAWSSFAEEHADQVLFKYQDWYGMLSMRKRLRSHRAANQLLFQGGQAEVSIVGRCVNTGLEVRCRVDHLRPGLQFVDLNDLKTTRDATKRAWERQAADDGLHVQAAMYIGLASHLFELPVQYRFPVIAKSLPWKPMVFELEDQFLECGVADYLETVFRFRTCVETGLWECEDFGDVETLQTPFSLVSKYAHL